jgi:hypothetical protein
MRDRYQAQEEIFANTMTDRQQWERATEQTRHMAVAADAELRRRHPDQRIELLRSAEPKPVDDADQKELHLAPDEKIAEMAQWVADLAAQRQAFGEKLAERQAVKVPSEDPEEEDLGPAFPTWNPPDRGAILQPPSPKSSQPRRSLSWPGSGRLAGTPHPHPPPAKKDPSPSRCMRSAAADAPSDGRGNSCRR